MNNITLIASYSEDELFDKSGQLLRKQRGGPAFFCGNALKKASQDYNLITGKQISVEIIVDGDWELGKIPEIPEPKTIDISKIPTPAIFYNPIIEEFILLNASQYIGKIFLDVQGLVRNGNDSGKKKLWNPTPDYQKIFCVKATTEELQFLPKEFIEEQKNKLLLITNGRNGVTVFAEGKKFSVSPREIISSPDTVGAGDTFFAYFISQFLKTNNPLSSTQFATEKTGEFLRSKIHHN